MGGETLAVADAGPLIHLDELGALSLFEVFAQVLVPEAVVLEVERHRPNFSGPPNLVTESIPTTTSFVSAVAYPHLQQGELAALAICKQAAVDILLTDDLAARDAAKAQGLTPVGSLGIILRAARVGLITVGVAERHIVALGRQTTLFTTPALIETALRALHR